MANQNVNDRKDRSGGGDVTKAEAMKSPAVPKTVFDLLNSTGPSHLTQEN
jgi:hypothetical protein